MSLDLREIYIEILTCLVLYVYCLPPKVEGQRHPILILFGFVFETCFLSIFGKDSIFQKAFESLFSCSVRNPLTIDRCVIKMSILFSNSVSEMCFAEVILKFRPNRDFGSRPETQIQRCYQLILVSRMKLSPSFNLAIASGQ